MRQKSFKVYKFFAVVTFLTTVALVVFLMQKIQNQDIPNISNDSSTNEELIDQNVKQSNESNDNSTNSQEVQETQKNKASNKMWNHADNLVDQNMNQAKNNALEK